jgi:hypothetical protein
MTARRELITMIAGTVLAASAWGSARAAGPATAPAVVPAPDYSAQTEVAHVPFANRVDFDRLGTMNIRISINGGPPMEVQVDTGSVGVIVGADQVPGGVDPHGPPGSITYVSSGVEIDGVYAPATITFLDAKGSNGRPVTASLPVLAAQTRTVHPGAVNGGKGKPATASRPGPINRRTPHPGMFGVGFARGPDAHPERNPFINLVAMRAGTMRRGYTITREGFDLGLSPANTAGYLFEKLVERPVSAATAAMRPGLKDWLDAPGSVTVGDKPPIPVGILMDTGLTNFMIELGSVTDNADVPAGTPVKVDVLGGGRLTYTFKAGDKADPMAPRRVTWTHRDSNPLLNTGLRALAGFDYLFDADGGYFALRPTRRRG